MAITILQQPTDYTPAGNFIVFIVESDNTTEPNFKYVANVSINGNMIAKLKAFPNPSNDDRAVFNVQELVRNFFDVIPRIGDGISFNADAFACDSQIASLQVEFVEEYTGAPANSEDSNVITLWNGAFDVMEFAQWYYIYASQYRIETAISEAKPLTNRPQSVKAVSTASYKQSGNIYYNCKSQTTANYDWTYYIYYTPDGAPIRQFGIKTPNWAQHNSVPAELNDAQMIGAPFMPFDVYNISAGITSDGNAGSDDFPENGGYYSVQASNADGITIGAIEYFVYLNEDCSRFEPTEIHFENQLGAVDSYVFTKTNREVQTIERVQASKPYLNFNETGIATQYGTPTNYSRFNAQVDFTRQYTALSDWLTDAEFQWLQELLRSPRVWLRKTFQTDEGVQEYLVPILITDTNYNVYKRDIDQLKTLSVTYRFTFDEATPL